MDSETKQDIASPDKMKAIIQHFQSHTVIRKQKRKNKIDLQLVTQTQWSDQFGGQMFYIIVSGSNL